ncbi:heparan-alpha-glucosaminide N-acetyltransferase domain-containing protein [Pseudoclavibacter sp. RFBB5]|uniref:heparan-alpha-glucosaminide N-acetyltransferase domain-containing protein n=1 Tax=Pseudoclavibacter sp. RFBB5 TaxID=2080574 RepID=UPI000CE88B79|nr:heparan-alpha-glucosaminide N-acetyltransferase domain-containing protein [Pseudoclavibacter sp. RFBB5]
MSAQSMPGKPAAPLRGGGPAGEGARRAGRITGLDLARFLALIGMMATHVWVTNSDGSTPALAAFLGGKAAALFAVLAGIGVVLTTRKQRDRRAFGAAALNVFGRGLALMVIGMTLGLVPGPIAVILVYYGLVFWLVAPLLRLSNVSLLMVATAWAGLWPFLSMLLRAPLNVGSELGTPSWLDLAHPLELLRGLFVTGTYPVLTWVVYAIVGMVVGRMLLVARERGTILQLSLGLTALGSVLALLGVGISMLLAGPFGGLSSISASTGAGDQASELFYSAAFGTTPTESGWFLASPAPHSGTTFDLAITAGTSIIAIGLCLAVCLRLGDATLRVLGPALGAGATPLTIYTLHVIVAGVTYTALVHGGVLADAPELFWLVSSAPIWLIHVACALAVGAVFFWWRRRGPLEAAVTWTGQRFASLTDARRE